MDATASPPRRRLSLALRMFLLVAALLLLAVGSAVLISLRQGSQIAREAARHALEASAALQAEFAAQRLQELQLKLQLIAADAAFVNYIADAQAGAAGVGDTSLAETASIFDLLVERQESFGFELGLVLDHQGAILARTDQPEAFEESLAEDPFVAASLAELRPVSGYWRMGNGVYQAAILPLAQGEDLIGFLLLATPVDRSISSQIRRVSDADVAFLLPVADRIALLGSSLPESGEAELRRLLDQREHPIVLAVQAGEPLQQTELQLGDGRWIAQLSALEADAGPQVGAALQLVSAEQAEAGYREILNSVALAGIAALVVALPLSLWLTRRSLQPLRSMARMAKDAVAGQYQSRMALGGNDELGELSSAFDSLLSDLRGERDIESYVTHLSRLLPEPGDEPVAVEAVRAVQTARREDCALIGVDTRSRLQPAEGSSPEQALATADEFITGLAALAGEYGGRLLAATGTRALFAFGSARRRDRALHFARELLSAEASLALAAIEGSVVSGQLGEAAGAVPAGLGVAVQQLDRLLAEALPERVLLPKGLGDALRAELGAAAVQVVKGGSSGKPFYAMDAAGLRDLPEVEVAPSLAGAAPALATVVSAPATVAAPAVSARSASGDLPAGTRLGGRFRVLSVLGSGGMGVVYKARDLELDDVVALKMLKGEALADREQLERLKSEIKLARRITHPNVLRTFDFGEIDGHPFISMEYVRGMTLRYLLKQSERIPFTAALRIARQLCAGLQAAHEVGVLHRDIKPENLILEASGNAKLMDFGIARPIRRTAPGSTEPGMYVGTPAYSAPEQLAGQDVDHRADIFATGVLLSELFSGQLPFAGSSTVEIYMAQMNGEPRRPSAAWPAIPAELEAIILRCIQRRPEDRFASAAALVAELAAVRS